MRAPIVACYLFLFLITAIVCLPKTHILDTSGIDGLVNSSRATYVAFNNDWFKQGEVEATSYYDHPPVLIWFNALVFKILGTQEFHSKILIMIFGLLCVFLIFHFGIAINNYRTGLFAALYFLLLPRVAENMTRFMRDIPLVFFALLAFFALYQLTLKKSCKYIVLFWGACGLAVLMKGIVGLGPVIACCGLIFFRRIDWNTKYFFLGLLLFVAIIMSVDLIYYLNLKHTFWKNYWHYQVHQAITGANESNYQRIPVYFQELLTRWSFGTIFLFIFPWKIKERWPLYFFILLWIACFVIPLSCAKKNAALYLLPIAPALALCAGMVMEEVLKINFWKKLSFISAIVLVCSIFYFPQLRLSRQWATMRDDVLLGDWLRHVCEPAKSIGFMNSSLDERWLKYYSAALERKNAVEQFSHLTSSSPTLDYYLVSEDEYGTNKDFFDKNGYLVGDTYQRYFLLKR